MNGKLYVVATPIGNLNDFTPRGLETLKAADFIAAEDTRVTIKLLNRFELSKPMISYYKHNYKERGEQILKRILDGESCALLSDAGTPAISDPGEELVKLCIENGIEVIPIPGCCAAIAALSASGIPSGRFTFEGFLSMNRKNRKQHLAEIKDETRTMIFYEAPHKLLSTLKDLLESLGDRSIVLAREVTKIHEEFLHLSLSEAIARFSENSPRGEFVLILPGLDQSLLKETPQTTPDSDEAIADRIKALTVSGLTLGEACKKLAKETGIPKNELYRKAVGK